MLTKRLYRSRDDRMICGVAGGIAAYLGVDPTIVRLIWAVSVVVGVFPAIVVYIVCCLVLPNEPILS
jgi:phage shock protein C